MGAKGYMPSRPPASAMPQIGQIPPAYIADPAHVRAPPFAPYRRNNFGIHRPPGGPKPDMLERAVDKCLKSAGDVPDKMCVPKKRAPGRPATPGSPATPGRPTRPRLPFPRGTPAEWTADEEFEAALLSKSQTVRGRSSGRLYTGTSLCCLEPSDEPRRTAIRIVETRLFDPIILLTIAANCATMAWESPLDEMLHPGSTWKSGVIGVCEKVYLGIFTFELLTKVLAYGFIRNSQAYLRDSWCQLDFVVVTLALRLVDTPPRPLQQWRPTALSACSKGGHRANA